MFDSFSFLVIIILLFISAQYNFSLIAAFILLIYFLWTPSWWNLILLGIFVFSVQISGGSLAGSGYLITIILLAVILISNIFIKRQPKEEEPDFSDFSKLFGGGRE
ncbi:MAG: hypothetical protein WCF78_00900 [archaeon]